MRALAVLFASLAFAPPAWAWNADGHRIVCAIAWDELKPFARERVQTTLAIQTRDQFAEACTWADQLRKAETKDWHFVDVAFGENYVRLARDCGAQQTCALEEINLAISELDGGPAEANKAEAIKWLGHLVGDIHEPLNVTHPALRALKGEYMGRAATLLDVWSGGLSQSTAHWRETANALENDITDHDRDVWQSSRPIQWADESLVIANDLALAHESKGAFALDQSYAAKYVPTVHQRFARAGVRLAYLLNTIYAGR